MVLDFDMSWLAINMFLQIKSCKKGGIKKQICMWNSLQPREQISRESYWKWGRGVVKVGAVR